MQGTVTLVIQFNAIWLIHLKKGDFRDRTSPLLNQSSRKRKQSTMFVFHKPTTRCSLIPLCFDWALSHFGSIAKQKSKPLKCRVFFRVWLNLYRVWGKRRGAWGKRQRRGPTRPPTAPASATGAACPPNSSFLIFFWVENFERRTRTRPPASWVRLARFPNAHAPPRAWQPMRRASFCSSSRCTRATNPLQLLSYMDILHFYPLHLHRAWTWVQGRRPRTMFQSHNTRVFGT